MFVKELRKRVDHYFRITVRTLRVNLYLILGNNSKEHWNIFSKKIPIIDAIFIV